MTDHPLILILGGVRSGKSSYAEKLAAGFGPNVLYIATGQAGDEEMRDRIRRHQLSRPDTWRTLEAARNVGSLLGQIEMAFDAILLDCLTLLTSNILLALETEPQQAIEAAIEQELESILAAGRKLPGSPPLIIVSNEVGMGVVPPYKLGRVYRDLLGRANQRLAQEATRVIFMVAGLPMTLSPLP